MAEMNCFFKPKDFDGNLGEYHAEQANKILSARALYVHGHQEPEYKTWHFSSQGFEANKTHQAMVINIQKLSAVTGGPAHALVQIEKLQALYDDIKNIDDSQIYKAACLSEDTSKSHHHGDIYMNGFTNGAKWVLAKIMGLN